jgi:hypothetical protein
MHRVVRILLFVLCLVSVSEESEQLASIWPLAENCSKLKAIHSMRRGAGRGKPDGPKREPIALGFKCVHCRNEFDSRHTIDCHRRHRGSVGTPCADPRNHKSTSPQVRSGAALKTQLAVGSRSTVQWSRTTDSGRQTRSSSGRDLLCAGDHPVDETRANRDLCWDRAGTDTCH